MDCSKFTSTLANFANDLFSETTAPMVLKFHVLHGKAAGLPNAKIQAGQESIWPLLLKIAKPLRSTFLLNNLIYWVEILYRAF